jgi:putative flippase GtrA
MLGCSGSNLKLSMAVRRFYTVGLACALLHNAIVIGGDRVGLHYVFSLLVSFAVVVLFGYGLHSRWTFRGASRTPTSFGKYTLIASANYPISLTGMFLFVSVLGARVELATPVVTVLLAGMNYFGSRWALRAASRTSRRA